MLTEHEKILMQRLLDMESGFATQRKAWAAVIDSMFGTLNMLDNNTNGQIMKDHPALSAMREEFKGLARSIRESRA